MEADMPASCISPVAFSFVGSRGPPLSSPFEFQSLCSSLSWLFLVSLLRGGVLLGAKIGLYEAAGRLLSNCIVNHNEDHSSASKEKLHYHYKVSTLMIVTVGCSCFL